MPDIIEFPEQSELDSVDIYNGGLSYGIAILQANLGKRVRRAAWKSDLSTYATFVFYIPNNNWEISGINNKTISEAKRSGFLVKYNKLGTLIPYVAGSEDILAEDWELIDPDEELF